MSRRIFGFMMTVIFFALTACAGPRTEQNGGLAPVASMPWAGQARIEGKWQGADLQLGVAVSPPKAPSRLAGVLFFAEPSDTFLLAYLADSTINPQEQLAKVGTVPRATMAGGFGEGFPHVTIPGPDATDRLIRVKYLVSSQEGCELVVAEDLAFNPAADFDFTVPLPKSEI